MLRLIVLFSLFFGFLSGKKKTFASPCVAQAGVIISCYATFTEGVAARRRHRDLSEADGESVCEHESHVSSAGLIRPRRFTVQ